MYVCIYIYMHIYWLFNDIKTASVLFLWLNMMKLYPTYFPALLIVIDMKGKSTKQEHGSHSNRGRWVITGLVLPESMPIIAYSSKTFNGTREHIFDATNLSWIWNQTNTYKYSTGW